MSTDHHPPQPDSPTDTDPTDEQDSPVDGETLDAIQSILQRRYAKRVAGIYSKSEQAITAGELASEVTGENTDTSPKTREAVKALMREQGVPVIGDHDGYRIPVERGPVDEAIESLEGRISGINERIHILQQAWDSYRERAASPDDAGVATVDSAEESDRASVEGESSDDSAVDRTDDSGEQPHDDSYTPPTTDSEAYERLSADEQRFVDAHSDFTPLGLWQTRHGSAGES